MNVPKSVSEWVRSDTMQTVIEKSIFEYMDGAGELYLGYRFDRLEAFAYRAADRPDILLEIYHMKTADDAFGLLSLDWNGESIPLDEENPESRDPETVPPMRALYGSGLLRIWSGNLYFRILAFLETPEARGAVIALGKACIQGRRPAGIPEWMQSLPLSLCAKWNLEKNQVRFLRTHRVLNSIYFLSYSDILGLDLNTEIAAGRYRPPQKIEDNPSLYLFTIRYGTSDKAREALSGFHNSYFPDAPLRPDESASAGPVVRFTEGKWSGYMMSGPCAVLGFEFPDGESAAKALNEAIYNIENQTGGQR